MPRVVLVRQGEKYPPEYVSKLIYQLKRVGVLDIVTLTDMEDTPGLARPLRYDFKGWWAKIELFAPEQRDLWPFLFLDLDTFVFHPLDQYHMGDHFHMVRDFNEMSPGNSSVMWVPFIGNRKLWDTFIEDPKKAIASCGGYGDQKFIARYCNHFWGTPESGILSYKQHGVAEALGNIMTFHGRPKPHEVKQGWVKDWWQRN